MGLHSLRTFLNVTRLETVSTLSIENGWVNRAIDQDDLVFLASWDCCSNDSTGVSSEIGSGLWKLRLGELYAFYFEGRGFRWKGVRIGLYSLLSGGLGRDAPSY